MKFILRMTLLFAFHLAFSSSVFGQTQLLDGDWQFSADRGGVLKIQDLGTLKDWRVIRVPFSWNSQFEDLRDYRGVGWYRRTVNLGAVKTGQAVLLKFGAVDYLAEVFINGKSAGQHEGGFLPFTFEIEKLIKPGANEIAVRVTDPDNDKSRWGDLNYNELPHGKQSWYVETGGIWQSVTLTIKPQLFIKDVKVTAKIDGKLTVRVRTSDAAKSGSATAGITDPRGRTLNLGRPVIDGGEVVFNSRISNPELWSISKPNLYKIEVRLGGDRFHDQFGFRSFEARDGKLYLNGEPIYIISALDQDFYPEGIYTPPSYEFLLDQMRKAKALGLNMLRTHIKVPTPDYLRAADETGVLIWYEIPSWDDNTWTPAAARRGEEIFLGQLERDWNHPSIVIQTIINEAWGVRGLREEHTRKWLKEAFLKLSPEAAKAGRLTVDNSPCCGNFHIKSDLADYHQYNSIPDNRRAWDKWVADFASRPAWLWSRNGDAEPTGKEPLILSEFGNWGLPSLPDKLPWWFERDFNGREVTRPAGIFERFHAFKFDRMFAGFNELAQATQRHQWLSLKHEIEEIRKHPSIQGYTITEFTDLNWECNGLLDMFRNKKIYADDLARLQQQDVIFAQTPEHNFTGGEKIGLTIYVSRYSDAASKPQTIRVIIDGRTIGEAAIKPLDRGSVAKDQSISLTAPSVSKPTAVRTTLELRGLNNTLTARNYFEFFVYPKTEPQEGRIYLAGGLSRLAEVFKAAGFTVAPIAEKQALIITDKLDQQTLAMIGSGYRAIVLANDKDALSAGSMKIAPRNGATGYDGNWVTNFNWINPNRAPFKFIGFDKLLGFEAEAATPGFVIDGIATDHFDDVMSGIFLGWVNKNAAFMVQTAVGDGKTIITTFRLAENYEKDEYSRHLLNEMINLLRN
ncbi:MAG: hypothetical protein IPO77_11610 [Acidobacteria bacterium]|nr:hypothetical protein [Acidobacteriota bacterium]